MIGQNRKHCVMCGEAKPTLHTSRCEDCEDEITEWSERYYSESCRGYISPSMLKALKEVVDDLYSDDG